MKIISSLIYLGGQAHPPPPPTGHNKTNKLRRSIKELGGGSTSLTPPPPDNLHSVYFIVLEPLPVLRAAGLLCNKRSLSWTIP